MRSTSDKKRTSSQAEGNTARDTEKKKLKVPLGQLPDSTKTVTPRKAGFKGVKAWLADASEKELDSLLTWLVQRKKVAGTRTQSEEKLNIGRGQPQYSRMLTTGRLGDDARKVDADKHAGKTPAIIRKISRRDVEYMQQALFPEDRSEPRSSKMKLGDRWDQHTRSVKRPGPMEKPWEGQWRKPSGSSLCGELLTTARSRLFVGVLSG